MNISTDINKMTFLYDNGSSFTAVGIHKVHWNAVDIEGEPCIEYSNYKGCHRVYLEDLSATVVYFDSGCVSINPYDDRVVVEKTLVRMQKPQFKMDSPLSRLQLSGKRKRKEESHMRRYKKWLAQ